MSRLLGAFWYRVRPGFTLSCVDHADERLQELILYIAGSLSDDPQFGLTKLNKVLWTADFRMYGLTGSSITGQEYQKIKHGPAPRRLMPALDRLGGQGKVKLRLEIRGIYVQKRLVALKGARLDDFTNAEIAVVDKAIDAMRGLSNKEASDLSHKFPGWKAREMGETIPYSTIFVSTRLLSEREREIGRQLARCV